MSQPPQPKPQSNPKNEIHTPSDHVVNSTTVSNPSAQMQNVAQPQSEQQDNQSTTLNHVQKNPSQDLVQQKPPPYQVRDRVFNPCNCCCCHFCNLRANCIGIGVFAILCALLWTAHGVASGPPECDTEPAPRDCSYPDKKSSLSLFRAVILTFVILYGIVTIATGVCIFVAVIVRIKETAYAAVAGWILSSILFTIYFCIFIVFFDIYTIFVVWSPIIIFVPLKIYCAICCLQHGKQIKKGTDREPHRLSNNIVLPQPGLEIQQQPPVY